MPASAPPPAASGFSLALLLIAILRYGVIAREETYLERRFGDAYRDYKSPSSPMVLMTSNTVRALTLLALLFTFGAAGGGFNVVVRNAAAHGGASA